MTSSKDITYEIIRHIGVVDENIKTGWKREINLVSWNGGEAKYDIREWNPDHTRMNRGITLTLEQATSVADLIKSSL